MGDPSGAIAGAIEPPQHRVLPTPGLRRHRPLTGTAGILLFVCMFLPAMKGCSSSPVLPLDVPPFLPPYLYGLVFAMVALTRTRRGLIVGTMMLRALATIVGFAGFIVFLIAPSVGIVELSVGLALVATIGTTGVSEHRIAATAIVMGAVCTAWFGLWSMTADALIGVHLSLASSTALLVGGCVWLVELWMRPPAVVPAAIVRRG